MLVLFFMKVNHIFQMLVNTGESLKPIRLTDFTLHQLVLDALEDMIKKVNLLKSMISVPSITSRLLEKDSMLSPLTGWQRWFQVS